MFSWVVVNLMSACIKGIEMVLGVILVSVEVVQMSGEVVGLSGDGVWVSEVACKPVAQGSRQP